MDIIITIILGIIIFVVFIIIMQKKQPNTHHQEPTKIKVKKHRKTTDFINKIYKLQQEQQQNKPINQYFQEMQFNDSYRDTMDAFNAIVPNQKQLFNRADMPVTILPVQEDEIKELVESFINEVNKNVRQQKENNELITPIGWNNFKPDPKIESGWDKQQKALGLPTDIYEKSAKIMPIELVKIDKLEKYQTEDEIRYVVYMIVQKTKKHETMDQMVLRVSFVVDIKNVNGDRTFFNNDNNSETEVNIEEIFIIGYMTNKSFGSSESKRQDFYNFDSYKGGLTNDDDIIKELNKKKREYKYIQAL